MSRLVILAAFTFLYLTPIFCQVQSINGIVTDGFSGAPLSGVIISTDDTENKRLSISNADGSYTISNIPVGRINLKASMLGYQDALVTNLLLISGKQTVANFQLKEKVTTLHEVEIRSSNYNTRLLNSGISLSSQTFSVEQTERFAGSLGDPARMVANYAGVMAGNDSRNDIVIRGNSPLGVSWRLEGVDIPNPNHFGALGTTGGSVSMLNSNLLSKSNFLTGAFPSEFGNTLSGVFDLSLRSGNTNKFEFTGQVGFNGFEGAIEGPINLGKNKTKGSFIIDYRYSTLDLVSKMGMDIGTGTAVPEYQDLSLLIDLPTPKLGRFKIIGLTGKSMIRLGRDINTTTGVAHSDFGSATDFGAKLSLAALTHVYFFSSDTRIKTALSFNNASSSTIFDTVNYVNKSFFTVYKGTLSENTFALNTELRHKISTQNFIKTGINVSLYATNLSDSSWVREYDKLISIRQTNNRQSLLSRAHVGFEHRFSDKSIINTGVNIQHFSLNNEVSIEPRLSFNQEFGNGQNIQFGYGLHSQIQPRLVYFLRNFNNTNNSYSENNKYLNSTKAHHFVAGYEKRLGHNISIKAETYFQALYNVPISKNKKTFSMLNEGAEYHFSIPDSLTNDGYGRNYGIEFTLEKKMNEGYYFLLTVSLFEAKYQGSDKVWRNTAFNTNRVVNLLGGYEWKLGKNNFITFDTKTVWSGGRRTSPIDLDASIREGYTVYDESKSYSLQLRDYFRTDFRIGYRINGKRMSQEWGLDLQNLTNHENVYSQSFNPYNRQVVTTFQQSFMPMMLYRINF